MLGQKIAVGGAAPRTTLVLGESEEGEGAEWGTQGDPWQERTWQQEEQEFKTATKEKTTFAMILFPSCPPSVAKLSLRAI